MGLKDGIDASFNAVSLGMSLILFVESERKLYV